MTTLGQFNSKSPTVKRILKEAAELSTSPSPDYAAGPLSDANIFEWHFTLRGPPAPSPFAGGLYHGRIVLPPTYPLRPPSFRFLTPSGRFEPNREICLSISGHHEESWQPAWGVRTALVALRSFMDSAAAGQLGGVEAGEAVRRRLAAESKAWRCVGCGGRSCEEMMREREEQVTRLCGEGGGVRAENESVPEELKLGYKDEMGGSQKHDAPDAQKPNASVSAAQNEQDAKAESTRQAAQPPSSHSQGQSSPPSPPRTQSQTSARQNPVARPQPRLTTVSPSSAFTTGWTDTAIAALAVALLILILKKLLSPT